MTIVDCTHSLGLAMFGTEAGANSKHSHVAIEAGARVKQPYKGRVLKNQTISSLEGSGSRTLHGGSQRSFFGREGSLD